MINNKNTPYFVPNMKKYLAFTCLIAILFIAVFLRIDKITDNSITVDEGFSYYISSAEEYGGVFSRTTHYDLNPPGYYLILHPFARIFGEKEMVLRIIPLISSIFAILFLYLLLSLTINKRAALIASFLMAISSFFIAFSLEIGSYMLLTLFTLAAYFFLVKALRHPEYGTKMWLYFTLASLAALYTNYLFTVYLFAFLIIFLINIFSAEEPLKKTLMLCFSIIITIIGYSYWLPSLITQLDFEYFRFTTEQNLNILPTFLEFSNGSIILGLSIIILMLITLVIKFRSYDAELYKEKNLFTYSLFTFLIIGITLPIIYSIFYYPVFNIHTLIPLAPIIYAIIAIALYKLTKIHYSTIFPIIIIIVLLNLPLTSQSPKELKQDHRKLISYIQENEFPVIVHNPKNSHVLNFYNKTDLAINPFPYTNDFRNFQITPDKEYKFIDLTKDMKTFYLVIAESEEKPPGLLISWSHKLCQKSDILEQFNHSNVYLFSECN